MRDVRFNETKKYNPKEAKADEVEHIREKIDEIIKKIEIRDGTTELDGLLSLSPVPTNSTDSTVQTAQDKKNIQSSEQQQEEGSDQQPQLLSPDLTPEPSDPTPGPSDQSDDAPAVPRDSNPDIEPFDTATQLFRELEQANQASPVALARGGGTTMVSADLNPAHVIEGPRRRQQSERRAAYMAHLNRGAGEMRAVFNALAKATVPVREHQSDLTPPSKDWNEMLKHPKASEFLEAAKTEWVAIRTKNMFETVPTPPKSTEVLPLKWVFMYKLDDNGFLLCCKAQICV
jgi:hypothetical protein